MAVVAVYLGVVDEDAIDNMSFTFFNSILSALGKRVNYDAIVNYAGNSFAKDSWKLIQEANPLIQVKQPKKNGFDELLEANLSLNIKTGDEVKKQLQSISWANVGNKQQGDNGK